MSSSNFIGDSLDYCRELGFKGAMLVGHIGKLVKLAGGMMNTHSKYGDCRMHILAAHAGAVGLNASRIEEMLDCATCDDGLRILKEEGLYEKTLQHLTKKIGAMLQYRAGEQLEIGAILFSKEYGFLSETENAQRLLQNLTEE